ncbi:hypothetical protein Tco_0889161 [Tanacetum coccineum]
MMAQHPAAAISLASHSQSFRIILGQHLNILDTKDQDWEYHLGLLAVSRSSTYLSLLMKCLFQIIQSEIRASSSLSSFITIAKGGSSSISTFFYLPAGAELVVKAEEHLLPLAGAEEGSAPVSFSSGGRGCYRLKIHPLNHNKSLKKSSTLDNIGLLLPVIDTYELSAKDFTNTRSFGPELEILFHSPLLALSLPTETLSSSARAIRALTSVTSLSSDDISSLSQSYDSTIRPLFLPENELRAEALELRRASLALTLLYLALKSLVCLGSGLCSDEWRSFG